MDLDRTVHLYFDYAGAAHPEGREQADRESGVSAALETTGKFRAYRDRALPAREMYAAFEGCTSVAGNDHLFRAIRAASIGFRTDLITKEGRYHLGGEDLGEHVDLPLIEPGVPVYDLGEVDLDGTPDYAAFAERRIAATLEEGACVMIDGTGRTASFPVPATVPGDTVEILHDIAASNSIPEEAREFLGEAYATLEATPAPSA